MQSYIKVSITFLMTLFIATEIFSQEKSELYGSAAKVNITPQTALEMSGYGGRDKPFTGVHDSLYFRILLLEKNGEMAAILAGDISTIGDSFWKSVTTRIEEEISIPVQNILIAATHTHGGPRLAFHFSSPSQKVIEYTDYVADQIIHGLKKAESALVPVTIGAGTGRANININRKAKTADGAFWIGRNPDGPSDKQIHVLRVEKKSGEPIAAFINYSVHATVMGPKNSQITADVAGSTARYVEQYYDDKIVALWTSGAAGDQAPIYNAQGDFGGRIRPVDALGQILGEEVVSTFEDIRTFTPESISGKQSTFNLPGKTRQKYRPDGQYTFEEADSVEIRLSLLKIGSIALAGVSGEVLTMIDQRLERETPMEETIMVTHCNGSCGYLADDESYIEPSYEVAYGSIVQKGAEDAIVNNLIAMMK